MIDDKSVSMVTDLVTHAVPRDQAANVLAEFKKDFVFSKKKSRRMQHRGARASGISRAEKRRLGLYSVPRTGMRFADAEAMHALWQDYMRSLLELENGVSPPQPGDRNWETFSQSIHRAELQGALATVVRSKCPSLVGANGVVVLDTRCTFSLITRDNRVITVPKKQCVFELEVGGLQLQVYGKHLAVRPADRATRKVKQQLLPDL